MSATYIINEEPQLEQVFPLMQQLRPHLNRATFEQLYSLAHKADRYQIHTLEKVTKAGDGDEEREVVAAAGFRYLHDFVHGFHLYLDDLVVAEGQRSQGLGKMLMDHCEQLARENGCTGFRLCTGVQNVGGVKFYERLGLEQKAVVFKRKFEA